VETVSLPTGQEPFVDAERAASFLSMPRKTLLAKSRKGYLPGHPIGQGPRKTWRFRLSELAGWMEGEAIKSNQPSGSEREDVS
jgi:hypothetical protein